LPAGWGVSLGALRLAGLSGTARYPVSPEELAQHNCLHYSFFAGQSWHFLTPEGESLSVAVSGNLSASISSLLMDAAIKHCGIAMLPEREASAALEQGLLVPAGGAGAETACHPWHLSVPGIPACRAARVP
jgi:DNA-binding transcriptional LysR family regulator